jgi:hypothetical protein
MKMLLQFVKELDIYGSNKTNEYYNMLKNKN